VMPLVLLGGTFDPPHRAHFALLRAAGAALNMTHNLQLLIAADPWQKQGVTPLTQRLEMLKLGLDEDNNNTHTHITISLKEANNERNTSIPTYSIDTLKALRAEYGDTPIVFVLGWDQWLKLPTWHRWQALTDYAHLCIAPRVNAFGSASMALMQWSQFKMASEHQLRELASGCIFQLPQFEQPISSTELRTQLREGSYADASPWLYPSVLRYIQTHQLYL
jgi:nicotinate-nucleotide adenylyltransferase